MFRKACGPKQCFGTAPDRKLLDLSLQIIRPEKRQKIVLYTVHNATRSTTIGDRIARAGTSSERTTGLLKRSGLENGEGLWIIPCEAVHTFFMKFPLDLIYIDRKLRIRKAVRNVAPWRVSACLSAHSIIELPAGMIDVSGSERGDQLEISLC
jgi:uncharacterized protein